MKKTAVLSVLLMFSITSTVFAQDDKPKGKYERNEKYLDEGGLSAELQVKIENVKKINDEKVKAVNADKFMPKLQKQERLKELRIERKREIDALLASEGPDKDTPAKKKGKKKKEMPALQY